MNYPMKGFDVTDPDEDAPDGAVVKGYQRHGGRWEPIPKGTKVSIDVPWPNGRVTRMSGTLYGVHEDEAYVITEIGTVAGPLDSLEVEE